ncbi:hypothetical protein [Paenibacillus illinoisensis]|uniref:hypothetical protein n=1 Tax=Paenibacillus illinoisensis TaxID=59845 RepID=UPI00301DAC64
MTEAELTLLLTVAKRVHPNFSVEDEFTFGIWFELVSEVPFEVAQSNLKEHLRKSDYPPKPASLVGDYFNKSELSVYDQQALEHKELMLSIETPEDECVPMPDSVERAIDQISNRMSFGKFGGDGVDE